MGFLFLCFWWLHLRNDHLDSTTSQEPDYRECDGDDDEDVCETVGKILLSYCISVLAITLINRAYIWVLQKYQEERLPSEEGTNHSKVPRDSLCMYHRKVNVWDFLGKVFSGENKKHSCQSADPILYSGVAAAKAFLERKRAKFASELRQPIVCDTNSSDTDSEDLDSGASSWKESETESIPTKARLRRRKIARKKRNRGSRWIREQHCLRCKARRTVNSLSQRFFNSTPPPHGKSNSLEDNSSRGIAT